MHFDFMSCTFCFVLKLSSLFLLVEYDPLNFVVNVKNSILRFAS